MKRIYRTLIMFNMIFLTSISLLMINVLADGNDGGYCSSGAGTFTIFELIIGFLIITVLILLIAFILKKLSSN